MGPTELAEVGGAIEVARAAVDTGFKSMPKADVKPPVEHRPADSVPKFIITPEAAAMGLGEVLARAEAAQLTTSTGKTHFVKQADVRVP